MWYKTRYDCTCLGNLPICEFALIVQDHENDSIFTHDTRITFFKRKFGTHHLSSLRLCTSKEKIMISIYFLLRELPSEQCESCTCTLSSGKCGLLRTVDENGISPHLVLLEPFILISCSHPHPLFSMIFTQVSAYGTTYAHNRILVEIITAMVELVAVLIVVDSVSGDLLPGYLQVSIYLMECIGLVFPFAFAATYERFILD